VTQEQLAAALSTEREARIRAEGERDGFAKAMAILADRISGKDATAERRRAYDRARKARKSAESGGSPVEAPPSSPPPSFSLSPPSTPSPSILYPFSPASPPTASQAEAVASPPVADGEELPDATEHAEEERPPLVLETQDAEPPKPERKPRTPSAGEALYARLESQRQQACEMDAANGLEGVHFIPSRWAFSRQNKQLGPIAKTQTSDPEGEWARFSAAWGAFLDDTEVAARLDEPYALDYFLRCRGRYEGKALKGAA
jgi:hypothetical protein